MCTMGNENEEIFIFEERPALAPRLSDYGFSFYMIVKISLMEKLSFSRELQASGFC
uniref:Uncharacterized protein n=1 Tax=Picea sitchensis TaxID=3332 RepID=B8LPC3_PICSI|nr:unknown [Picea sitchensis]